ALDEDGHPRNELPIAPAVDHRWPNGGGPDAALRMRLENHLLRLALRPCVVGALPQRAEWGVLIGLLAAPRCLIAGRRTVYGDAAQLQKPRTRRLGGDDRIARSLDVGETIRLPPSGHRDVRGRMEDRVTSTGGALERRFVQHITVDQLDRFR